MAIYRRDQPEYNAAVANGAKNIQLTGGGALAGGKTWDGKQLNTPAAPTGSATPRLDGGSATPRLDAGNVTPRLDKTRDPATIGESFAQTDARKRAASAASGAFGKTAQQDSMRPFVQGPPKPSSMAQAAPTATPTPSAPLQGKALAQNNIATMGTQGAVADYFKRSTADKASASAAKDAGRRKQWNQASAMPQASPMAPMPAPSPMPWRTTTPPPAIASTPPPAQNFTVPTPASVQPIAATPSVRPAPAPAPTAPAQTPNQYGGRLSAKFSGPNGFSDPRHKQEMARQNAEKAKRQASNKANLGKGSTRPGLLDRTIGGKPSWMSGSIAGSIYDGINK